MNNPSRDEPISFVEHERLPLRHTRRLIKEYAGLPVRDRQGCVPERLSVPESHLIPPRGGGPDRIPGAQNDGPLPHLSLSLGRNGDCVALDIGFNDKLRRRVPPLSHCPSIEHLP